MKKKRALRDRITGHQMALSLVIVLLFSVSASETDCPIGCKCSRNSLVCTKANLSVVPVNISNPENVTTFKLAGNNLSQIQAKDFLSFTNLENLDLSHNFISSVEEDSFKQLKNLQSLDLSGNKLASLPEHSFSGMVNLSRLVLRTNDFVDLKKSLNGVSGLKTLILSHNAITDIRSDAFDGSESIETIDLNKNQIYDMPTEALQKLPNLQTLLFANNRVSQLTDCSIGPLTALKFLQMQDNAIANISNGAFSAKCQSKNTGNSPASAEQTATSFLQTLDLSENQLTSLSPLALSHLVNLQSLNLSMNAFSTIESGTFQNMPNVYEILISFMSELKTVENGSFTDLNSLLKLDIHNCPKLTQLTPRIFNNVTSLNLLRIYDNGFETVSQDLFTFDEKLQIIASGNPLKCDCRLQWIPELYRNMSTNKLTKSNLEDLLCMTPVHLRGIRPTDLMKGHLRCLGKTKTTHARIQTAAIAAVVCAVIGILLILFVKFRNRICIFVKRQFRYKAHKDNRELFSVKLSEIIGENDQDPFYEDPNLDLRLRSLVDTEVR